MFPSHIENSLNSGPRGIRNLDRSNRIPNMDCGESHDLGVLWFINKLVNWSMDPFRRPSDKEAIESL